MVCMKRLLQFIAIATLSFSLNAQTTIYDFETPSTTVDYQYFGSSLEATQGNIIANPDASGINTSSMVGEHIKPADSQVWAGAFANPQLPTSADMVVNNMICLKVWFNEPGNLALKLEASSSGGPNWIITRDVTESQTWVEVCYDVSAPSIEDPFLPASGHIYDGATLFFDFGTTEAVDRTYYFDDLVVKSGGGVTDGDITFSVDMNDYSEPFTTVYVSGSFNGWDGESNPLEDPDMDGVWTGTVNIPTGAHEFKYTVDNWAVQEELNPFMTCVITDDSGAFTNRRLISNGDATLETVCFNSCYACGEGVNITFEVGQGNIALSPEGLFIAGGGNFANPGDFPMADDDLDGIWSITIEREKGFFSFYTFTNGACQDFSCKEDISGQACADPDNFNDRFIPAVQNDTTVATCFGVCADNTDDCASGSSPGNITFQVDMNEFTGTFTLPHISGEFNGWDGEANPLDDADGDGIWETTLMLNPADYEFKFAVDNWATDEQFNDGDPCTITDDSGTFVNRIITVDGDSTVCFLWNTCTSCAPTSVNDLSVDHDFFQLSPNLVAEFAQITFFQPTTDNRLIRVYDTTGSLLIEQEIPGSVTFYQLNTSELSTGMYLVNVLEGDVLGTRKMIKQ